MTAQDIKPEWTGRGSADHRPHRSETKKTPRTMARVAAEADHTQWLT